MRYVMTICPACDGTGRIKCWSPGGPCHTPDALDCETCGECEVCKGTGLTPLRMPS